MKKGKKKVVAAAAAPSRGSVSVSGGGGGGEGDKARFKYQSLLQDYEELVRETEAKRKKLLADNTKKQNVLAEVRFLRRKYKSLSANPSQTSVYRLKPPMPVVPTMWMGNDHQHVQAVGCAGPSKGQLSQRRQDFAPRSSPVIDLNEACEPSSEEMEEFHGVREPFRVDKAKKHPLECDAAGASDVKVPALWDVRNTTGRVGKRKISWQDQLALRV